MSGTEAQERTAAADVKVVVVGVCDAQMASIFSSIAIRVTHEGSLGLFYCQHVVIRTRGLSYSYMVVKVSV